MTQHLAQGSAEPTFSPGKLGLYGMRFCPYDHRVHLVLIAKNIPHETAFINLGDKPDWFLNKVQSAKVPALVVGDDILYESLIISDYLDEKYPQRPLHSKDPLQKARDRILMEEFQKVTVLFRKMIMNKPSPVIEDFNAFVMELVLLDQELAQHGTTFFAGNEPGMVDYMIWPWFERLAPVQIIFGNLFKLPEGKIPHLVPWMKLMLEDRAVKEYVLNPELNAKFLKSYVSGQTQFDFSD